MYLTSNIQCVVKYVDAGEESNVIFRVVLVKYVDAGEESNLIFRVAKQCTI